MSLRIAAHKSRRCQSTTKPAEPVAAWTAASSRAAQAAARVAARYAQAPSYSQMQLAEATPAPRAAAIATPAPDAAAKSAIAELPVTSAAPRLSEPAVNSGEVHSVVEHARTTARDLVPPIAPFHPAAPSSLEDWENECAHGCWEPDLRLRPLAPVPAPVPAQAPIPIQVAHAVSISAAEGALRSTAGRASVALLSPEPVSTADPRWEWPESLVDPSDSEEIRPVEPDLPIHANLIEFPRELVATRKIRPRRAEGPFAAARSEMQLSIFEVDPGAISNRPESFGAAATAVWPEPAWAEIELEPQDEVESQQTSPLPLELEVAPLNRRVVAALTDSALIAGVVLGPAFMVSARIGHPPVTKIMELGAVSAILLAGLLYHTLFLTLAGTTPGMRFAGISLCTFDGQIPTRAQLRSRLGALLLSLVPVGLGIAWALFDDGHLSWHDRLSRTYLREN